jgi:hypothetical protein
LTYLAIYAALLLLGFLSFKNPSLRRAMFPVATAFLFAFVAFRFEVGCDWSGYQINYEKSRYLTAEDAITRQEPGWWLLLTEIHAFELDYPYLNVLMAIPFFWGLARLAAKEPDPLAIMILAFPVLIINLPMSGIRQGAAVGFICLAFIAFRERRLAAYVASVLIASTVHTSAVVFLALAPFAKFPLTRMTMIVSGILLLPGAHFMLADTLEFYADRYVGTGVVAAGALYRSGMLAAVGGYFLLTLKNAYRERYPADYQLTLLGSWIMLASLVMVPISSVISDRFGYYVTPIQLMIMARIPYLVSARNRVFLSAAPYAVLGLALIVWTNFSALFVQCYLPYQTWLHWHY